MSNKIVQITTLIIFIGLLFLPLFDWLTPFKLAKEFDETRENRALTTKPIFNVNKLDPYPKSFDDFVNDNIPFRENILRLNEKMGFDFATKTSSKSVFEGLGGFYFIEKYRKSFENKILLTQVETDSIRNIFEYRSNYLENKGIAFYVVVVPVKSNVYPEMMPKTTYRRNEKSIADQFLTVLNEIDGIETIDLRNVLIEDKIKSGIRSFHKTDQHWNEYGAFVAYTTIINKIAEKKTSIKKLNLQEFAKDSSLIKGKQCVKILGLENKIQEMDIKIDFKNNIQKSIPSKLDNPYLVSEKFPYPSQAYYNFVSKNDNGLKILWIRDSYANAMKRIFRMDDAVSENVLIWDNWCYRLNEEIVEGEKPDVYVLMIIESNIPFIIHKHPSERS